MREYRLDLVQQQQSSLCVVAQVAHQLTYRRPVTHQADLHEPRTVLARDRPACGLTTETSRPPQRPRGIAPVESGQLAHRVQDLRLHALVADWYLCGPRRDDGPSIRHRQLHQPRRAENHDPHQPRRAAQPDPSDEENERTHADLPMSQPGVLTGPVLSLTLLVDWTPRDFNGDYPTADRAADSPRWSAWSRSSVAQTPCRAVRQRGPLEPGLPPPCVWTVTLSGKLNVSCSRRMKGVETHNSPSGHTSY